MIMIKEIEEKLKEYYLEEVEKEELEILGWKVLDIIDNYDIGRSNIILKTNPDAWPAEFFINLVSSRGGEYIIILVSPECPEVYFLIKDEITEKIKEVATAIRESCNEYLIYEWEKLFKRDLERSTETSPYISTTSITTLPFDFPNNTNSSIWNGARLLGEESINSTRPGDIVYDSSTSSAYIYDGTNFTEIKSNLQ